MKDIFACHSGYSMQREYMVFAFIELSLAILAIVLGDSSGALLSLYVAISTSASVVGILVYCAHEPSPIAPLPIFLFIWMLLVALTALPAPMMRGLTAHEILPICFGGFIFCLAGAVSCKLNQRRKATCSDSANVSEAPLISPKMRTFFRIVLIVSCVVIVANLIMTGSIRMFGNDDGAKKTVNAFFGYTFFSSFGTVSFLVFLYGKEKSGAAALDYFFCLVYIVLQLLTGQRWFVVVAILLVTSVFSFRRFRRKEWLILIGLVLAILLSFLIISLFRNSADSFQKYFIETGRYSGTAKELSDTEVIRYFGMSQRNMGTVISRPFEWSNFLQFSLTPLLFLIVKPTALSLGTNIQAYTANNILSYLISDAGIFWWLLLLLLSLALHQVYFKCRYSNASLTHHVYWGTCVLGLTLSFFSYINAYFYWVGIFPLIVFILERIDKRLNSMSRRESDV